MFCVAQFAYCQDSSIITYSEASAGVNFISDDDVKERVINRFLQDRREYTVRLQGQKYLSELSYSYEMVGNDDFPKQDYIDFTDSLHVFQQTIEGKDYIITGKVSNKNRKRLGITVFQPRLKVCTFARTNSYEYGKQRQVQESA